MRARLALRGWMYLLGLSIENARAIIDGHATFTLRRPGEFLQIYYNVGLAGCPIHRAAPSEARDRAPSVFMLA